MINAELYLRHSFLFIVLTWYVNDMLTSARYSFLGPFFLKKIFISVFKLDKNCPVWMVILISQRGGDHVTAVDRREEILDYLAATEVQQLRSWR